ncbi:MAG: hypothetical protein IKR18_02165 [Bacteroidaceae bacterium]|nr:hypothetical protein [Bacteroidaceae bacterium]
MKNWKIPAIISTIIAAVAIIAWFCFYELGSSETRRFRVCVVFSFTPDEKKQKFKENILKDKIRREGINAEYRFYYLDCNKYDKYDEENRMRGFIEDVKGWKPDVLLPVNDQATFSLLVINHPFVRKVPVVFCSVNFPNRKLMARYDNIGGVVDEPDYLANVRFISNVIPGAKIEMVYESTALGQFAYEKLQKSVGKSVPIDTSLVRKNADSACSQQALRREGTYISMFPFRSTNGREVLHHFNENSRSERLVFLLDKYDFVSSLMASSYNYPVFSVTHKLFDADSRIVGGYFSSSEDIAKDVAKLLRELLLEGGKLHEVTARKDYYADYNEYVKWGLSSYDFPSFTTIVNEPWYERYSLLIAILGFLSGVTLIVLFSHMIFKRTRHAREKLIVDSLDTSRQNMLMDVFGENYVYWALHGKTLYLDHVSNIIFGNHDNVMEMTDFLHIVHPSDRDIVDWVFSDRSVRGMKDVEYRIFKNGRFIWHRDYFNVVRVGKEELVVGFARYIHDEKTASLRDITMRSELSDFNQNRVFYHNFRMELLDIVEFLDYSAYIKDAKDLHSELDLAGLKSILNDLSYTIKDFNSLLLDENEMKRSIVAPHSTLMGLYNACIPQERKGLVLTFRPQFDEWIVETDAERLVELFHRIVTFFAQFDGAMAIVDYRVEEGDEPMLTFLMTVSVPNCQLAGMFNIVDALNYTIDKNSHGLGLELPYIRLLCTRLGGTFSAQSAPSGMNMVFTFSSIKKS